MLMLACNLGENPTHLFKSRSLKVNTVTMSDDTLGVVLPIPLTADHVFRYQAMDDILTLLVRNPHQEFTVSQLRDITEHGGKTVNNTIELLKHLDLIQTRREGKKKLIQVNRDRISASDDPLMQIPQDTFRDPIRVLLNKLQDEIDPLIGVIVFGSVARGEADRASDIDVLVVAEGETVMIRRAVQEVRQEVESQRFDGERYEFQIMGESVESAKNYGEKLQTIFTEGVMLYETDELQQIKEAVFSG